MTHWPARESFKEGLVDLSKDEPAMSAFARRMGQALRDEDLAKFATLSRREPLALFFGWSASEGEKPRAPFEELELKDSPWVFDAGMAWSAAAGAKLANPTCQDALKNYANARLPSNLRRPAVAFLSATMHAAHSPASFSDFVWELGAKLRWDRLDLTGPDIEIWGGEWTRQARESDGLPRWCAKVAGQALARRWEGAHEESRALIDFAKGLGDPEPEWLWKMWVGAKAEFENERRELEDRLARSVGIAQARLLANQRRDERLEDWEAMALDVCANAPPSWAANALGERGPPELAAKMERVALAREAAPGSERASEARL